jgi:Na+/H+-dicarboxylate symporter
MIRTAVNITGDCVVSTVVAHSEGLHDRVVYDDTSDRDRY